MSSNKYFISDEELNAFLDEQLDANERDRILDAINSDSDVSKRMSELSLLRDMVQHAYEDLPRRRQFTKQIATTSKVHWAVAACLVLSVGVIVGWFGHQGFTTGEQVAKSDVIAPAELSNVILHITSADPDKISAALDKAESMLISYQQQNKDLRLEVIANDGGLNLMREGMSSFQPRIQQLKSKYGNIEFLACAKAIKRLQEKGIDVELLPEVRVAPSALRQIIQRMQEDWRYVKA